MILNLYFDGGDRKQGTMQIGEGDRIRKFSIYIKKELIITRIKSEEIFNPVKKKKKM